jgi:hypothetical protein
MDFLLELQISIISIVLGVFTSYLLCIKYYVISALICVALYLILKIVYCGILKKCESQSASLDMNPVHNTIPIPSPNSFPNSVPITTKSNSKMYPGADSNIGIGFAREQDLASTKYSIFHKQPSNGILDENTPPFDNLDPKELSTRLNYIYYATSNPYEPISYSDYKTAADKQIEKDGTGLLPKDAHLQAYAAKYYPQLSANQIDARDCLNEGSGDKSCFQSPALFANLNKKTEGFQNAEPMQKQTSILSQGLDNINKLFLHVEEGFSDPMILDPNDRFQPIMFRNAPGNQDVALDQTSNEHINLNDNSGKTCRHCKLAVCENDICSLQNQLFM